MKYESGAFNFHGETNREAHARRALAADHLPVPLDGRGVAAAMASSATTRFVCIVCIITSDEEWRPHQAARTCWLETGRRARGSHHQFKHPERPGRVTIPHPKKDLPIGTVSAILKQAGLK